MVNGNYCLFNSVIYLKEQNGATFLKDMAMLDTKDFHVLFKGHPY